jgi:hypothetical protein
VLAVLSALILLGGGITAFIYDSQFNYQNIAVDVEDGMNETVEFKHLSLIPGGEAVYTVSFSSRLVETYIIDLSFNSEGVETLADYVRLKIDTTEGTVKYMLLRDYITGEKIQLELRLNGDERTNVVFTYYMPSEVGNEAQCTEAEFSLKITAKHLRGDYE